MRNTKSKDKFMYIRGRVYRVPCVNNVQYGETVVILPAHSDNGEDCLNPVADHYHVDFRFEEKDRFGEDNAVWEHNSGEVYYREKRCLRNFVTLTNTWPFFLERLHGRLADHEIQNGVCPHKGAKIDNKCGTCPAHGLRWNLETKRLYYKPPFFLKMETGDKGIIRHGECVIPITKELQVPDSGVYIPLYDSNGLRYKNAGFHLSGKRRFMPGDQITITDKNCGNAH